MGLAAEVERDVADTAGSRLVLRYLTLMEEGDLAQAQAMLADGFRMVFPGDNRFTRNEDLVAYWQRMYQSVHKTFERFDSVPSDDGTVVYCFGRLRGAFANGTPFANIRFIDRFTVRSGKLIDQMVWNDIGLIQPRA
jgi:hypothetical protein